MTTPPPYSVSIQLYIFEIGIEALVCKQETNRTAQCYLHSVLLSYSNELNRKFQLSRLTFGLLFLARGSEDFEEGGDKVHLDLLVDCQEEGHMHEQ